MPAVPVLPTPPVPIRAGGLLVTAAGVGVLALRALTQAVSAGRTHRLADVPRSPVAVVLGAQVFPGGRPSGFLVGRLEIARDLWRAGKIEAILVSGDNDPEHHGETDAMKAWLVEQGVPAEVIACDPDGHDTFATMSRAVGVYQLSEAIVVSQLYHLPRALTTARALGLDAHGVGDVTARRWLPRWRQGVVREVLANIKMVGELFTRDRPDEPDNSVLTILTRRPA